MILWYTGTYSPKPHTKTVFFTAANTHKEAIKNSGGGCEYSEVSWDVFRWEDLMEPRTVGAARERVTSASPLLMYLVDLYSEIVYFCKVILRLIDMNEENFNAQ